MLGYPFIIKKGKGAIKEKADLTLYQQRNFRLAIEQ
jgi:hypothetical protein